MTPELKKGAQLGPYVVEEQLGAGGMGEVFRARDTRLGRAWERPLIWPVWKASPLLGEPEAVSGSSQLSAPRLLFRVSAVDDSYSPYEVASDGQRFLVRVLPGSAPLSAIVNWPKLISN